MTPVGEWLAKYGMLTLVVCPYPQCPLLDRLVCGGVPSSDFVSRRHRHVCGGARSVSTVRAVVQAHPLVIPSVEDAGTGSSRLHDRDRGLERTG